MKKIKLHEYDTLDFLDTEEKMIDYLNAELEEGDIFYIKRALKTIARGRDVNEIIKKVNISPDALDEMLANDENLDYSTLKNYLNILDLHLMVVPNGIKE